LFVFNILFREVHFDGLMTKRQVLEKEVVGANLHQKLIFVRSNPTQHMRFVVNNKRKRNLKKIALLMSSYEEFATVNELEVSSPWDELLKKAMPKTAFGRKSLRINGQPRLQRSNRPTTLQVRKEVSTLLGGGVSVLVYNSRPQWQLPLRPWRRL
jgi:hypothetical protein